MPTRSSGDRRSSPRITLSSPPDGRLRSTASPSATPLGAVMSRWSRLWMCLSGRFMVIGAVTRYAHVDLASAFGSFREHPELRDIVVPFDQRRNRSEAPHRVFVKRPYLVAYRMVVRVEQMRAVIAVTSEMVLDDALDRDRIDVFLGTEPMIERAHEDVVDVEQDSAIGFLGNRAQKLPLAERRITERHVAGNIFDQDVPLQNILHPADSRGNVAHDFFGVGQRKQVMKIVSANTGPAQMVGDPCGLEAARQRAQLAKIIPIQRIRRSDRQRHAMHHDRMSVAHRGQNFQRTSALNHEVLRNNLEPIHRRMVFENVRVVGPAKTDSKAEKSKVRPIHLSNQKRTRRASWATGAPVHDRSRLLGGRPTFIGAALFVLFHREALALAAILTLAIVRGSLACALALAGVAAHALHL